MQEDLETNVEAQEKIEEAFGRIEEDDVVDDLDLTKGVSEVKQKTKQVGPRNVSKEREAVIEISEEIVVRTMGEIFLDPRANLSRNPHQLIDHLCEEASYLPYYVDNIRIYTLVDGRDLEVYVAIAGRISEV